MKIKKAAKKIEKMGRKGDTILAHINPKEAAMLKAHGGAGKRHPKTGLLQFYDGSSEYGGGDFSGYEGADFSGSTGGTDFGPSYGGNDGAGYGGLGVFGGTGGSLNGGKPGESNMAQAQSQMDYSGGVSPSSFNWGDALQSALRGASFGPLGMIGGGIVGGYGGLQNALDQFGGMFSGTGGPAMGNGFDGGNLPNDGATTPVVPATGGTGTGGTTTGLPITPPNWGNYGPSPFTYKFGQPRNMAGLLNFGG